MAPIHLVTSFNGELLARFLSNKVAEIGLETVSHGYGQVMQPLTTNIWENGEDGSLFVWAEPHTIFPEYAKARNGEIFDEAALWADFDLFCQQLVKCSGKLRYVFVASCMKPLGRRGLGMLNYAPSLGPSFLIDEMNLRMAKAFADAGNIFLLEADRWIRDCQGAAYSSKMWMASKIPFTNAVLLEACEDLRVALDGVEGRSRRLVIVDLDDTLWGGVVGENGWQGVELGGHNYNGEAFLNFQRALLSLTKRGIQLGIVSKNNESVALEAIDNHPEMVLRRGDFAGWRINWDDKAANVAALAKEINLGLSSVVFIDDNPSERARIKDALPDVFVPDWPKNPAEYESRLLTLRCFDTPKLSEEDRARTSNYVKERTRRESIKEVGSLDDWLMAASIRVTIERLSGANLARASQLINKTNQMNLTTRRLSENELEVWAGCPENEFWAFRVSDRFGDYGLTAIMTLRVEGDIAMIEDFLLSCRVMGRKIEETLLHFGVNWAAKRGMRELRARFRPTERNAPCLDFFIGSGLVREGNNFSWATAEDFPKPEAVTLVDRTAL